MDCGWIYTNIFHARIFSKQIKGESFDFFSWSFLAKEGRQNNLIWKIKILSVTQFINYAFCFHWEEEKSPDSILTIIIDLQYFFVKVIFDAMSQLGITIFDDESERKNKS